MIAYEEQLRRIVQIALLEDLGPGDITSEGVVPPHLRARGVIVVKAAGRVAGLDAAREVYAQLDGGLAWRAAVREGDRVNPGDRVAEIEGSLRSILAGERVALNFLQHLSGIATRTAEFVEAARGTRAKIYDTRKTTPGLRALEKRAVAAGGGHNHRMGLYDAVLIKENHLEGTDEIARRVQSLRDRGYWIEIEAATAEEAEAYAGLPVDAVLLDNFPPAGLSKVVRRLRRRKRSLVVEVSGGITLENVAEYAASGVDRISVGAITHSAPALDMSLRIERVEGS